jgi:hypothetical protein
MNNENHINTLNFRGIVINSEFHTYSKTSYYHEM